MNQPDPKRLGEWYDAHAARLLLYARQWLDPSEAEDMVQSAFLRLASQDRTPANVKAWLFTTVRHAAISAYRSRSRRGARERLIASERPEWFQPQPSDLIDAKTAQLALAMLPDDQREVIVLRLWGGLGWNEAAEVVGQPVSTIFSRYKAGLASLREHMEPSCSTKMK